MQMALCALIIWSAYFCEKVIPSRRLAILHFLTARGEARIAHSLQKLLTNKE